MPAETEKRPLKILQVASHNEIRAGGSIQMMRLALGLKARGHDVHCAFNVKGGDAPSGNGTFAPLLDAGIPVKSFPMQRLKKYRGMFQFRKFAAAHGFDVVHTHRFRALGFVCAATRWTACPVLIGNRKISFSVPQSWAKVYGSSRVDAIIVNAQVIKDLLVETGRINPDKIEIIYNGVDLERFHPGVDGRPLRQSFGFADAAPVFGMIANFARKKSHHVFFEAAAKVLEHKPEARFIVCGKGDCSRYERFVQRAGAESKFVFAGFRTDIPEIIAALDVSVIASEKGEGLTGSLVESMVMETPVVSARVGGNEEFVRDGDTGRLVPPGRADALAEAMLDLIDRPAAAREMAKRAFALVKDHVDNRRRTERFENLYYELLDRREGRLN